MNILIENFEAHTGLEPKEGSKLLGIANSTYHQYRSGLRTVPEYVARTIEFLILLENSVLNAQIRKHVFNGNS